MKLNLDPKTLWPDKRTVWRRLTRITLVLLPLSLVVFALLVRDWRLNLPEWTEETRRHLWEWATILVVAMAVTFLASSLPSVRRFLNRLFNWRVLRKMLIGLAWVATLVVLFYAEEDWRGWHAWNLYRQQLEAGGAQLDLKAFIPKTVPDDQNFAAIPVVNSWFTQRTNFDLRWSDHYAAACGMVSWPAGSPGSTDEKNGDRRFLDLVAWQKAFAAIQSGQTSSDQQIQSGKLDLASRAASAPAVLAGLVTSETSLAELRAASDRPYARYPVVYDMENPWGILLPHLGNGKRVVQRLQLRACAELAAGRSEDALADVRLMLYLADSFKSEPFLISYLVRIACLQLTIQPVWEGLAEHAWSDAQLQELQAYFQQCDYLTPMERCLASERAAGILTANLLAEGKYTFNVLTSDPTPSGSSAADMFGRVVPRGWYYLEQLNYCRLFQLQLNRAFDVEKRQVYPKQIESNSNALEQAFAGRNPFTTICTRHQLLAVIMLPSLHIIPMKAAAAQTAADEAAIACALERYRLANGQYPDNLDALIPKFISQLPNDVISGEPYKYHRTNETQFVLYSIGWNETDDGGVPGNTLFDDKEGDWVWQYPAK
ncbi:MAG TPA: hypothetical protein VJT54_17775 [Verrucomicrobiae bacterium]|nr:hypothetical protein [Verrucomicrobiae bacterium]